MKSFTDFRLMFEGNSIDEVNLNETVFKVGSKITWENRPTGEFIINQIMEGKDYHQVQIRRAKGGKVVASPLYRDGAWVGGEIKVV